jgi:ADP-ribosylglycohydrolase
MSQDRYLGCLLGLAVGDAVGTTVEFSQPGTFQPMTDMVGGGPFGLKPGQWTDDTSMALCLAESLVERQGFDPIDQLERYVRWWREGLWSSTGRCFDIGNTCRASLSQFLQTHEPFCGVTHELSAGNGSLMRLAPVPMYFAKQPALAIRMAGDSSRTTHGAATCIDACRYYAGLIVGALDGVDKDTLLTPMYSPAPGAWVEQPLDPLIEAIAKGSFRGKEPPEIRGTGYVVESLEAALWAFARSDNFRDGCLLAVNLGDDADTTAAIYGQLAGAFYGSSGIPEAWRQKLARGEELRRLALRLHAAANAVVH